TDEQKPRLGCDYRSLHCFLNAASFFERDRSDFFKQGMFRCFFSVQPQCSLCLSGELGPKTITSRRRALRLHRESIQLFGISENLEDLIDQRREQSDFIRWAMYGLLSSSRP